MSVFRSVSVIAPSIVAAAIVGVASHAVAQSASIIPPDRTFKWNPGMMSKGGIPNRTTVCAKLTAGNGKTDDSARIHSAIATCPIGQVVLLGAGTFVVNNPVLINKGITLRGAGAGQTILWKTNGVSPRTSEVDPKTTGLLVPTDGAYKASPSDPILIVGPSRWARADESTAQKLTSDAAAGSYSVTVANASHFRPGQFVLLDELSGATWQPVPAGFPCSDCTVEQSDRVAWNIHTPSQNGDDPQEAKQWFSRNDRPTSEIKEVASVSDNTVTFTSPLSISYRTAHTAQLTRYTATAPSGDGRHVVNAGVENMTLKGGTQNNLSFADAAYSWAKNVESTLWLGYGIGAANSFRIEIRDSYIHTGSWPVPGGGGYALAVSNGTSEALIENNILTDANKVMVFQAGGAGSVVAYNYTDNGWIWGTEDWIEVGLNASHMAGPHHVLFEGNYSFNADSDYTHGNSIYLTFFRNWLTGVRRDFPADVNNNSRTVGLAYGSWWDTFIGNILGRPGKMGDYSYTNPAMSCDDNGDNCTGDNAEWAPRAIWSLGYDPERWSMHPDPKTLSTVIRDGNYDNLTYSQHWHNTPGGFTIPNSLYLSAKPAFFGSCAWPWVDPTAGTTYTLPAKARFDAGTPNVVEPCRGG